MISTISTQLVVPNEASADRFVSAEHAVKAALNAEGNTKQVRAIWFGADSLEAATLRLARIVSHTYPAADGSDGLLRHAIREASEAFIESSNSNGRIEEHERAYLLALHRVAMGMVAHDVFALWDCGKSKRWRPFEQPLIDWVKKVQPDRVGFVPVAGDRSPVENKAAATMLATYLFRMDRAEEICAVVDRLYAC